MLDEPFQIPGDKSLTLPMMALTNTFDGQGSLRAGYTSVRVVCANTFAASEAEQDRHGHTFVFRHTKNWRERVEDARNAINGLRDDTKKYVDAMTHLAGVRVTPVVTEQFVREFIPTPPDGLISDRVADNIARDRAKLRELIVSDTVEGSGVGGTAYGLVQAAGEFLDHVRGFRSRDTYVGRQLLRPEPLKSKAITLVRDLVTASSN
jgi:phage/plasmid-like protein (TIGR03299 family)